MILTDVSITLTLAHFTVKMTIAKVIETAGKTSNLNKLWKMTKPRDSAPTQIENGTIVFRATTNWEYVKPKKKTPSALYQDKKPRTKKI